MADQQRRTHRGQPGRGAAPGNPPADPTAQPATGSAPHNTSGANAAGLAGARVAGRGLPPGFLAALRRSYRPTDEQLRARVRSRRDPLPQQRAAAALRRKEGR
jgi:hypothetical protein